MSDRILKLKEELAGILKVKVRPLFKDGVKLTIAARFDGFPDKDVLVTDDSMDGIVGLVERCRQRPDYEAGKAAKEGEVRP